MASGTPGKGIYPREASILFAFTWEGQRYRPTLSIPPTPANLRYAHRLLADIKEKIRQGVFSHAEFARHFPDYPLVAGFSGDTFQQTAESWLTIIKNEIAATTYKEYENTLKAHWYGPFGTMPMRRITYESIALELAGKTLAPKTYNNVLTPLRATFAHAVRTKRLTEDPAALVHFRKVQDPAPDPLTLEEVELALETMARKYGAEVADYYEVAFFAGLRPSEQIALRWEKISLHSAEALIDSARVRGIDKGVKTNEVRTIELTKRVMAAILRQKARTFLAGNEVFLNPATGRAYPDTSYPMERFWTPALKAAGIRHRDARQTRHTCATLGLMAQANPAYMAAQLGHSLDMFFRVYAKWINKADRGRERDKLDAYTAIDTGVSLTKAK